MFDTPGLARGGGAGTITAVERQSYIREQYTHLKKRIDDLDQVVAALEERCAPACTPNAPPATSAPSGVATGAPALPVPLADSLAERNWQLELLGRRLCALLDRLDL